MGIISKANSFVFKFFIVACVWTAGFLGLAAYASNRAKAEDPEILERIEQTVAMHFQENGMHISFNDGKKKDFELVEEKWNFKKTIDAIQFKGVATDVQIKTSTTDEIVVTAKSFINKKLTEKPLKIAISKNRIELREPSEDSFYDLELTIEIPKTDRNKLEIQSVSGDIDLEQVALKKADFKTVSGDIKVDKSNIHEVQVETVSGDIDFEIEPFKKASVESVSGDVHIKFVKAPEDTRFSFTTISGDLKNSLQSQEKGKNLVNIKTTSGDIQVE